MLKNNYYYFLFFVFLSLGFFIDDLDSNYSDLSTDLHNIIPIAMKYDNPDLFHNDLFLDYQESLYYYCPLFIKLIQLGNIFTGDYLSGIKLIHMLVNILFSIGWFCLFKFYSRSISVAFIFTILVRGVLWPPGKELWGIMGVWTFLPRTIFLAAIPYILILILKKNKHYITYISIICGILMNIHPVSSLVIYPTILLWDFFMSKHKLSYKFIMYPIIFCIFSFPFIYGYFMSSNSVSVDSNLISQAIEYRVGSFSSFSSFIDKLIRLEWMLLILSPYLFFLFNNRIERENINTWIGFSVSLITVIFLIFITEIFINYLFGANINVFFQFIRNFKYLLVSTFIIYCIYTDKLLHRLRQETRKFIEVIVPMIILVVAFVSKLTTFNSVPIIGDDVVRSILPDRFSLGRYKESDIYLDKMLKYIDSNIDKNKSIVGSSAIRAACNNSVPIDFKGAAMLIHGRKDKLVEWHALHKKFKENPIDLELLRSLNVDYILLSEEIENNNFILEKKYNSYLLYEIIPY